MSSNSNTIKYQTDILKSLAPFRTYTAFVHSISGNHVCAYIFAFLYRLVSNWQINVQIIFFFSSTSIIYHFSQTSRKVVVTTAVATQKKKEKEWEKEKETKIFLVESFVVVFLLVWWCVIFVIRNHKVQ